MKLHNAVIAIFAVVALSSVSFAQSMPPGAYRTWSQSQQQQAAGALSAMCGNQCASYTQAAKAGSIRATYEAAACTYACFVNNLPDDYPMIDQYKQKAMESYRNAKSLNSNIPVFLAK